MTLAVDHLSPRQRECLQLYWTQQATSKEIAGRLGIAKGTVDSYFAQAVETLGARDRREAARMLFGEPPAVTRTPPAVSQGDSAGVTRTLDLRALLPLRTGAHNDLSIPARLFWVVFLAFLFAAGFGAVVNGAHVLSDLLR